MNLISDHIPFRLFITSVLSVITIFVLEMVMPFHVLIPLGYIISIIFMLQFLQQIKYTTLLGVITTVLIILGYILKVSTVENGGSFPIDRGLSILVIWLTVYFSYRMVKHLDKEFKQKKLHHAIFNNAKEGMLIVNDTGKIILINSYAEFLFGYDEGELIGSTLNRLLPTRLHTSHSVHLQNYMIKPKDRVMGSGMKLLANRKDGSEFSVEISLSHFVNEEGIHAIAFIQDLTEKNKQLELLKQKQELAQTYFELASVLFVALDNHGNIISMNNYGSKLLGYSKETVIGKNWFTTFLSSDLQEEVFDHFKNIVNGEALESPNENAVLNNRGEEIEISWRSTTIKDIQGKVMAVLSAGTDITERKKQERITFAHHAAIENLNDQLELKIRKRTTELNEAVRKLEDANRELEKNQHLFKMVMHHFPDSVVGVLNKDLKYIFADGQEMHNIGLIKHDNRGERVFDNIHPALSLEAEKKLKTVFVGNRISYDTEIEDKIYSVNAVPLPGDSNLINEIIVVIRNITDRKRIEKELLKSIEKEKELTAMKSKFITMASHEFRTPLSTILSSVFLLENYKDEELENNRLTHINKIKRSVNNLTDLLTDFISLGKLEEGKVKVEYSEINIKEFLEELVPEMELIRKGSQIIQCQYDGEESTLMLDAKLLRGIFLNLLSNAIKYSSIDSAIKVRANLTDNQLIVKVQDEGIGIPQEEQRHIFKRFYRAHNAVNIEGTGLGLNIIKKYVRLMNGKIEFQSKLEEGTTFSVTFPRTKRIEGNLIKT